MWGKFKSYFGVDGMVSKKYVCGECSYIFYTDIHYCKDCPVIKECNRIICPDCGADVKPVSFIEKIWRRFLKREGNSYEF